MKKSRPPKPTNKQRDNAIGNLYSMVKELQEWSNTTNQHVQNYINIFNSYLKYKNEGEDFSKWFKNEIDEMKKTQLKKENNEV
jgi:flagellar hook-basal body complex protein FliE